MAALSGVTIRTLHHYDEIGLLSPSGRSAAGYRIYEESDLDLLQQILFYRELGFVLKEISTIVDDPGTDALGHLHRRRKLLTERIKRLSAMVDAIDYEMEARTMDIPLTPEERFEVFGEFRPEDHAEEAQQRWGETESYKESQRRVATYKKEDWQRLKAEEQEVRARLEAAFEHRGLADIYVSDERFRSHYDTNTPGLATFIRDAAHADAQRAEKDAR